MNKPTRPRRAVRALLWSDESQLLLVCATTPDTRIDIWLPPGGGVKRGETDHAALEREIWEETGHHVTGAGPPVWTREHTYGMAGESIRQTDLFWFLPVRQFEPTMANNPERRETDDFNAFRWWRLPALRSDPGVFVPDRIAEFLEPLTRGVIPDAPVDVGR